MGLMDNIRKYREERGKKDIFLKGLAARIKSLETKIDYKAIIDEVIEKINSRIDDEFEVGDEIRMNARANDVYGLAKCGSEGKIIQKLESGEYSIKFTKFTEEIDHGVPCYLMGAGHKKTRINHIDSGSPCYPRMIDYPLSTKSSSLISDRSSDFRINLNTRLPNLNGQ